MIQITPEVFINNWGLIKEGYLRMRDQFIITTESQSGDTNTIAITKPDEISAAMQSFDRRASFMKGITEPKEFTQEDSLPPEIDQWLPTAKDLTQGKRINYRKV
jgi:hypothetical protein